MKKLLLPLFLPLLVHASEIEAGGGIKKLNFNIGIGYKKTINDNVSDNDGYIISASVNIPVYKYIGSSLTIYRNKYGDYQYKYYSAKTDTYGAIVDLFIRDYNVGKLGISYAHSDTNIDYTFRDSYISIKNFNFDETIHSHTYSIYGSYYINDLTIGASRTSRKIDKYSNYNIFSFGAEYYYKNNTKLWLRNSSMDSNENYALGITHQPDFLNNSTEIGLSYSNGNGYNSYYIFVGYNFDTEISLKDRDRKYR